MSNDTVAKDLNMHLEKLKISIGEDIKDLLTAGQNCQTLASEPTLRGEAALDVMTKNILLLESEIEAIMAAGLVSLPNHERTLVTLGKEQANAMEMENERTLNYHKALQVELEEENKTLDDMIEKAEKVNNKLDTLLKKNTEDALKQRLNKRYESTGKIFRMLRKVLQLILNELYPEEEGLPMEKLLETLVAKMLEEQNDPYVSVTDDMLEEHISALIRCNLVMRHKDDVTRIRFMDPRH